MSTFLCMRGTTLITLIYTLHMHYAGIIMPEVFSSARVQVKHSRFINISLMFVYQTPTCMSGQPFWFQISRLGRTFPPRLLYMYGITAYEFFIRHFLIPWADFTIKDVV